MTLAHHELCFGCGSANLFGLQMELERDGEGVAGRFFVKQDHQGAAGAHPGVLASALEEAMALALHARGVHARARRLEVVLLGDAPVGVFLELDARVRDDLSGEAVARDGDTTVAQARGEFVALPR